MAYVAGFFDGEGTVLLTPTNGSQQLIAELAQVCGPASDLLMATVLSKWGGSLHERHKLHWRPLWQWAVSTKGSIRFLTDIRPWLQIKAEQADFAMWWYANRTPSLRDVRGRVLARTDVQRAYDARAILTLKQMKKGT